VRRGGFTIIELVVVLVLIGIIGSVVVPAMVQSGTFDTARTVAAPLVQVLRSAQKTAADKNVPVTVTIDPATGDYQIDGVREDTLAADVSSRGTIQFMDRTRFVTALDRLQVTFDPAGRNMSDSLVVENSDHAAVVNVNPWTGAIDVVLQR
jgi:prepilin-type N-terminal cleavage/methylation domain-containing protein